MACDSLFFIGTASETEVLPREHRAVFTHVIRDGELLRSRELDRISCGTAILSGQGGDPAAAELMAAELGRIHCSALLADIESRELAAALDSVCAGAGIALYVPAELYDCTAHGIAVECGSITAGSFPVRLEELAKRYGDRFALDLSPLRAEFTLPSDGRGEVLSHEALAERLSANPLVYYSSDLRARYFTYRQDGQTRFVIYDDAASLSDKLTLAKSFGARAVFMPCAEAREFISRLI